MIPPVDSSTCLRHAHVHAQRSMHIRVQYAQWTSVARRPQVSLSFGPAIKYTRHLINYGSCRIITVLPEGLGSESLLILITGSFLLVVWTVSQGERGIPGLPGDVVSINNREIHYDNNALWNYRLVFTMNDEERSRIDNKQQFENLTNTSYCNYSYTYAYWPHWPLFIHSRVIEN